MANLILKNPLDFLTYAFLVQYGPVIYVTLAEKVTDDLFVLCVISDDHLLVKPVVKFEEKFTTTLSFFRLVVKKVFHQILELVEGRVYFGVEILWGDDFWFSDVSQSHDSVGV